MCIVAIIFQLKKRICLVVSPVRLSDSDYCFWSSRKIWLHSKRQNMSLLSVSLVRTFVLKLIQSPPNSFAITFSRLDILLLKNVTSYTKIMRKNETPNLKKTDPQPNLKISIFQAQMSSFKYLLKDTWNISKIQIYFPKSEKLRNDAHC